MVPSIVRSELETWRIEPAVAALLLAFPFAGAAALAALADTALFRFLIREDSVLEWLQVVGYATAVIFGSLLALRLWRGGRKALAGAYALFVLGCFFVTGEELSWGERLFGLEAPPSLAEINRRGEINVHNVPAVTSAFKFVLAAVALYGSAVAAAVRLVRRPTEVVELLWPPLFLTACFLALLAYNCLRLAVDPSGFFDPEPRLVLVGLGEWVELCLAFGLGGFAALGWRRLRLAGRAVS